MDHISIKRILIFLVLIQSPCDGQDPHQLLELVTTSATLPAPSSGHVALYDGDDFIIVIGSGESGYVARYSIESEQVQTVGHDFHSSRGSAILEGEEITYFGGVLGGQISPSILNYSTVTDEWTVIVNMSTPIYLMSLAWDSESGVAYLFGGSDEELLPLDSVYRYDTRTHHLELVAKLALGRNKAGVAWDSQHGVAYVFGGFGGFGDGVEREILMYDPKTSAEFVSQLETQIPVRLLQSCAVYASVDKHIYVTSERGLLKFDPETEQIDILNVVGWPQQLMEAPCTYVPKRNRIYIVGGRSGENSEESDSISYVELTTNEPPTTDDPPSPLYLKHVLTDTRLPFPCISAATVYDGKDSIYVLGGYDGKDMQDAVVKYSLELDTAEIVGTFLPTYEGVAFMLDGDIIHVGGYVTNSSFKSPNVYNYSIAQNSSAIIATIPVPPRTDRIAVAWDECSRTAYLYIESNIYLYNPLSGDVLKVAEIQENVYDPTAIWYQLHDLNFAYTFGFGSIPHQNRGVVQFRPQDGNVSLISTILPYILSSPCVALAQDIDMKIYAFGSTYGSSGLIRFNPISQQAELALVEAWPRNLHQASCAYITGLQRLFILGGKRRYGEEAAVITSHISYVQFEFIEDGPTTASSSPTPDSSTTDEGDTIPTSTHSSTMETEEEHTFPSTESSTTVATATDASQGSPAVLFLSLVVGGPLLVLIILLCIGLKCYRVKLKGKQGRPKAEKFGRIVTQFLTDEEVKFFREGNSKATADKGATRVANHNVLSVEHIPYNANYEVAKQDLKIDFGIKLGSGHFGIVYKGSVRHWKKTELVSVAVKTVRPNVPVEYFKALMSELKILAYVGQHEYVASLIGAYTKGIQNGELFVAVELCKVSLLQYLRDQQNGYFEALPMTTEIGSIEYARACQGYPLNRWAHELAVGMEFLAGKHVVHGDLAARNVLLSFDLHVKICDFGLARQLVDYSYISTHAVNRPWKWMAIESLANLHFSTKSDVWAFGVTLWEIFTLGNVPYPCAAWNLDFVNQLEAGYRLQKPELASLEIYGKIRECWNVKKEDRPTFSELKLFFINRLKQDTSEDQHPTSPLV